MARRERVHDFIFFMKSELSVLQVVIHAWI